MNIELYIIKSFFTYSSFNEFKDYLDEEFLKANAKELYKLYQSIKLFHEQYPEKGIPSCDELRIFHFSLYPAASKKEEEALEPLLKKLQEVQPDLSIVRQYVDSHRERKTLTKLAIAALEASDGNKDVAEFWSSIDELKKACEPITNDEDDFVTNDLSGLEEKLLVAGFRWRLPSLNKMLGPLRKGDFGFVFARPESGKTTFLASEITFFAEQLNEEDGPIIWFNNEEQGEKVVIRCYQASLGITTQHLFTKINEFKQEYVSNTHGQLKIYDSASLTKQEVERVCKKYNPSIIIFDQIDKIKGFGSDRDRHDLELKIIYQWARELAKTYGPVIGVCQAGGTAEGKKWLTMDDVDSSKTSKQGEADWILGIGKSNNAGMESIRHLNLSKNKLFGDKDTIPELRHGMRDVLIKPEIARYEDVK
jgi:hypothetical protein